MNVVYAVNDRYVPQLSASIESLLTNNGALETLNVHVLYRTLSDESQDALNAVARQHRRSITFIPLGTLLDVYDFLDESVWDSIAMARLLLGVVLPESMNRVLYLDADTLVLSDISILEQWDLKGCSVGACIEQTVPKRRLRDLGLKSDQYFNSGVLLIDLQRWRAEGNDERFLAYAMDHRTDLVANDQDIINVVLRGAIEPLPPRFNYCNSYEFYPHRTLRNLRPNIPYYDEASIEAAKRWPSIVHFLGEERPWRRGNTHRFSDEYHRYLAATPAAASPDEEGWELYFLLWRLFNTVMKLTPGLRHRIMESLIPLFLQLRSRV